MRPEGKGALVTGSSLGIGRAIADVFAREGADVAGQAAQATGSTYYVDGGMVHRK